MSDTTGNALALSNETLSNEAVPPEALPTETLPPETLVPATTLERLSNGRFPPGFVANPHGRIRGSRNRNTQNMIDLLEGQGEAISGKLIDLALAGDKTALRLCIERLIPRRKSLPLNLVLPPLNTPSDVANAITAVIDAASYGEIDTDQARAMAAVLDARRKSFETIELEDRLTLIEKKVSRDISAF